MAAVGADTRVVALLSAVRLCQLSLAFAPVANTACPVSAEDMAAFLQQLIAHNRVEAFYVVFLDGANRLIGCEETSRGEVDSCGVEPSEIVLRAMDLNARRLIVAHNHPSGEARPSEGDFRVTKKLASASQLFRIHLVDHFIVTDGGFYSFRAHGYL